MDAEGSRAPDVEHMARAIIGCAAQLDRAREREEAISVAPESAPRGRVLPYRMAVGEA